VGGAESERELMAAIAQLKAMLGIDNKDFKAGVKDSANETSKFQKQLSGIGRQMAAAFSVGAIIQASRKVIDFASEIRHASDNMQVSTESLQALNAMALRYGVSIDMMQRGLAKMLIAQDGATKGEKTFTDALSALNIEVGAFAKLSPAEAMVRVGKAYAEGTNQAETFAAVADLLGQRIGPRLTAMLKDLGNEGLQAVIDQAIAAGMVIEDELLTKLEALGTKSDQIKLRLTAAFAPMANAMGEIALAWSGMLKSMSASTGGTKGFLKALINPVEAAQWWKSIITDIPEHIEAGAEAITGKSEPLPARAGAPTEEEWWALVNGQKRGKNRNSGALKMTGTTAAKYSSAEDKEWAAMESRVARELKLQKSIADNRKTAMEGARGKIRSDSMASVGIHAGPGRSGLTIQDRLLKVQIESRRLQSESVDYLRGIYDSTDHGGGE
jgi:hypothetical protein